MSDSIEPTRPPAVRPVVPVERQTSPVAPAKRPRWLRRFVIGFVVLLAVLGGLVGGAPYLVSTPTVSNWLLSIANARLSGGVGVKGLSLSWGGPLELRGVSVTDPEKRDVLSVGRVSCGSGVWRLLTGWESFGEVTVQSPEAVLYINSQNEISLVRAFELRNPSPPTDEPTNLPQLLGKAIIRDGKVRAVRENGPTYEVPDLNGEIDLATLGKKLAAKLQIKLPDGSQIASNADIRDLAPNGRLQLADASGTLQIQTKGDIDLAPLSALLAPDAGLTGTLTINGNVSADPKTLNADIVADVKKLQTAGRASSHAVPIDLSVKGTAGRQGDVVDAKAELSGDVGQTTVDVSFNCKSAIPALTAENLLSAIFEGTPLGLPDFRGDAQGAIDLVKLQQAVPGILPIRPGQKLTGGKIEISKVAIRGGSAPTANGSVAVRDLAATENGKPVRLQPIAVDFDVTLAPEKGLQIARADLKSSFADVATKGNVSDLQATFRANLSKMQQELGQIFDLSGVELTGEMAGDVKVARTGDIVDAKADLKGDVGQATADASFNYKSAIPDLTAEKLLSAILEGTPLGLPEFRGDVQGSVDLVRLQKALPGVLVVRPGQQLTGGKLEISKLAVRGGKSPTASGSVAVRELAATGGGQPVRLEPIAVDFDMTLPEGKGLKIARGDLKSSFADLATKGGASDLQAVFKANLSKMQQELGQIFDLSGVDLAGNMAGDVRVARSGEDRVDVTMKTQGDGVRVGGRGRRFEVQKLGLSQVGFVSLKDKSVRRYDATDLQVDLDGQVTASAKGWFDFKQETFKANAEVKQADLSFASKRAGALGVKELSRYSGVLTGRASAERASPGGAVATEGAFSGRNLGVDGKPVMEGEATLTWNGIKISGDGSDVTADLVKLASAAANVDAKGIRVQSGRSLDVSGDITGSADVQRLFRAIAPLTDMTKPPDIAGRLAIDAKLVTTKNVVTVSGKGGVDQFQVGSGKQVVREKRVDFDFDGRIDQPADRIDLRRCTVKSMPLTAEVNGTIDQFSKSAVLGLRGRYDASWDQLMAILHELTPATAKTVMVKGRSASAFEISGPMSQPGAKPEFRGVQSGADITWSAAQLYGVGFGAAKLSPVLRDGRLTLPTAAIPAAGGRASVGGVIDFQPADPTLIIAGRLQALENVEVTPEMGKQLLSYINPIFMFMSQVEGRVSMVLQDIRTPVNEAIKRNGTGRGVLDLKQLKLKPDGILGTLFEFGGLPVGGLYPAEISNVDFTLKDGRIYYDNFTMVFPSGYDLKFYGSVGFDDTVDLYISLPVTPNLLRQLKIGGPIDFTTQLTNLRIDIPMAGTRNNPRLDFAKVNTEKLLKSLLAPKIDPKKGIEDLLKGNLLGEKPKDGAAPASGGGGTPPPKSAPPPAEKPKKPLFPPPKKKK